MNHIPSTMGLKTSLSVALQSALQRSPKYQCSASNEPTGAIVFKGTFNKGAVELSDLIEFVLDLAKTHFFVCRVKS